ncbi:MAG: AAA family ATPase, partial [Chloroflexi bacterium]|nr:AAA family ATPase [Chloroflexota bacterium]
LDHLVNVANGDARTLLNALELAVETTPPNEEGVIVIDMAVAEESIQQRAVLYDREGDYHFDTISAFIKSLRGSDPDAALYWLAKMVYAGEDPRFIFRRMLISAAEDIGLADPQAIVVVQAAAEAFEHVGLPEGQFHLALAALYLATAPKSNSTMGYFDAFETVRRQREEAVPTHLRDASRDKEGFGHGEGYLYPHAYRDHWVAQQYLPTSLQGKVFYQPSDQGYERLIREQVERRREEQLAAMVEGPSSIEGLTYSPADPAQERWLMRAISGVARGLAQVRDRLFEGLDIRRHHLVLDLNAASGLITWEAVRRVPEGGVWALVRDETAAQALREQAERLDVLHRPIILQGELTSLPALLRERGDEAVRFDIILGRNSLIQVADKPTALQMLYEWMARGGSLRLAEAVPRLGQRLYALFTEGVPPHLAERWREAEEAIYAAPEDAMVNWGPEDLRRMLGEAGFQGASVQVDVMTTEVLITASHIARWFTPSGQGRPSYGDHLGRFLEKEEIEEIRRLFEQYLVGRTASWQSAVAYVQARRP